MKTCDPTVYLLAHSGIGPDYNAFLEEVASGYDPDVDFPSAMVEQAGRICYDSYANRRPGGHQSYIDRILAMGHGEVIEHATFTFCVDGISRSCATQLRTYRAGFSFCVRSSRYCDESEQELLFPPVPLLPDLLAKIEAHEKASLSLYEEIVGSLTDQSYQRKEARQAARYILPEGRSTALTFTCNARALRHMLEQRCSSHADQEIRLLANKIYLKAREAAPSLFNDYLVTIHDDGKTFTLATPNKKV